MVSVGSKAHKEGKQTQLGPVVFCLFDPETSDVEKREVARAIVCTPHPATIQLGKPHMPVLMPANPSLASFVGTDSWKLWELLGVGHAWL